MCNNCTNEYTCILHRNKVVGTIKRRSYELIHDDTLLVENLVLLNQQLCNTTNISNRVKLVKWISIVENMMLKKAA